LIRCCRLSIVKNPNLSSYPLKNLLDIQINKLTLVGAIHELPLPRLRVHALS
jgi:hypothetical protein